MPDSQHLPNALIHETSPYLLQHAHNPVQWLAWNEAAFLKAKTEDKPILLSVGYSACHWCHVMERESFENLEIAAIMNQHFVPVKVDREERPDVDSIYMTAVQIMTGAGGWPMTVFLTPEAKPFYGGTYFPPDDRYGRPGLKRVMLALHDAWQNRRQELLSSAEDLTSHLSRFERFTSSNDAPDETVALAALETMQQNFDVMWGGFGSAPKFPNAAALEWLLAHHARTGDASALHMLEGTLRGMANGGIYDHIGGGFARYSTDERWLVPHFEKMLYDNAQLACVYLQAFQVTGKEQYFLTAKETLEYLAREMTNPDGGFYSAQDADSEGVEGKFFVWHAVEIKSIVGEDFALFARAFAVTEAGNWEHQNVLWRVVQDTELTKEFGFDSEELRMRLESAKTKLFLAREQRIKPSLDNKILTSWNGLALRAFAMAGRMMGSRSAKYLAIAEKNAEFVRANLWKDERLLHVFAGGQAKIAGLLEDYAYYALGLLELYRSTFDKKHLEWATQLTTIVLRHFKDEAGGFYDVADDSDKLIVRPKTYFDGAFPSGNGAVAQLLLQLGHLTGNTAWQEIALGIVNQMRELAAKQPTGFGSVLRALEYLLAAPKEIAIVGPPERQDSQALLAVINKKYLPHTAVVAAAPGQNHLPVLQDRGEVNGVAAAYVCQNLACLLPVTTSEELLKLI